MDEISMYAIEFAWECPQCGKTNYEIEREREVTCEYCEKEYKVKEN